MPKYSVDFEPILREGQTANLFGTGLPENGMPVECVSCGPLPEYWKNFGALTAGQWTADLTDSNLEMNVMELAQFRFRIISEAKARMSQPGSVKQWKTKDEQFYMPQFPSNPEQKFLADYYWLASEFFVFQENTPYFNFYARRTEGECLVVFSGWRVRLQRLEEPGKIPLWVSEWPSSSPSGRLPRTR